MDTKSSRWTFTLRRILIFIPIFVIAFINFTVYWVAALCLGGDALNGYARDGHYYLGSHGAYTEVSRAVWRYSYCHTISTWVTHGLVFITGAIVFSRRAT